MRMKRIFTVSLIMAFLSLGYALTAIAQEQEGYSGMKSSVEETWQQNVNELRLYVNSLLELNQQLKSERDDLEKQSAAFEKSLSDLGAKNQDSEKKISALKQELTSLDKQLETLKKAKTVPCPEEKTKKTDKLLKECNQNNDKLTDSVKSKEKEIGKLQKDVIRLKSREDELLKEIAKLKKAPEAKRPQLDKDAQELNKTISRLQSENSQLSEKLAGVNNDLNLRLQEIEILKNENRQAFREKEISDSLLKIQRLPSVELSAMEGATKVKVNHELVGYNLARGGKYAQAIEEYQLALQENPSSKDIYFNLGVIYSKTKDFPKASDSYQKVLALDSSDKEALLNLSRIYEKLNDPAKSKYYYDLYSKLKQGKR